MGCCPRWIFSPGRAKGDVSACSWVWRETEKRSLMLESFHCSRKDLAAERTQTAPESGKMDTTIQIWVWGVFAGSEQVKTTLRLLLVERKGADFRKRQLKVADPTQGSCCQCEPPSLTATEDNTLRWEKLMVFHQKRFWGWVKHCLTERLLFKGRSGQQQMARSTPEVCLVQVRRSLNMS